ncbi:MAG: hypothetical protein ACOCVG_04730, partial [Verrucomicrobiota bacterium]
VVNASLQGDEILTESKNESLLAFLGELRERYGEHPSILATIGDYTEDNEARMTIYQAALQRAIELNYESEIDLVKESIQELKDESSEN